MHGVIDRAHARSE